MIEVTRIIGESIDLKNGQATGKLIVISDGYEELFIAAEEEECKVLMRMFLRQRNGAVPDARPAAPAQPAERVREDEDFVPPTPGTFEDDETPGMSLDIDGYGEVDEETGVAQA
jgi:hypothetical protein